MNDEKNDTNDVTNQASEDQHRIWADILTQADENHKRLHPYDTRSWEDRVDDACEADINGELPLDMAVCPYCGEVPELTLAVCCSPYDVLADAKDKSEEEKLYEARDAGIPIKQRTLTAEECEQHEVERERRLEELYGIEVVRKAREAQRAARKERWAIDPIGP